MWPEDERTSIHTCVKVTHTGDVIHSCVFESTAVVSQTSLLILIHS
jgi:hypothetical protein